MSNKPTSMLPQVGVEGSDTAESEKSLWIAVLNQAVRDARALVQKVRRNPGLWANPLFRSEVFHLKRYFRIQSMEPGGFGFICDLLEIDPKQAFQKIDEMYFRYLTPTTKRPANVAVSLAI